jgi:hypothetical protein
MNLTIAELNELLYCVGKTLDAKYAPLLNRKVAEKLYNKLNDELEYRCNELQKLMEAETAAVERWG